MGIVMVRVVLGYCMVLLGQGIVRVLFVKGRVFGRK